MAIRNSLNPIHAVTLAAGIATAALSGAALAREWAVRAATARATTGTTGTGTATEWDRATGWTTGTTRWALG